MTALISPETAADIGAIDSLHATVFGPGRFARTAFRLREQGAHDSALSFCIHGDPAIGEPPVIASVRLTWIAASNAQPRGLLLGPLAVAAPWAKRGFGKALMTHAIEAARVAGAGFVLLVGDPPYYAPFGFEAVPQGRLTLPGPVNPSRLLCLWLEETARASVTGRISHIGRFVFA